jgi:hypothetical protein
MLLTNFLNLRQHQLRLQIENSTGHRKHFFVTLIIHLYGHRTKTNRLMRSSFASTIQGGFLCKRLPPEYALRIEIRSLAQADCSLSSAWAFIVVGRRVVNRAVFQIARSLGLAHLSCTCKSWSEAGQRSFKTSRTAATYSQQPAA